MGVLTSKAQVTIPKSVRNFLGVGPGDAVDFGIEDNEVLVKKCVRKGVFDKFKGLLGRGKTEHVMQELR